MTRGCEGTLAELLIHEFDLLDTWQARVAERARSRSRTQEEVDQSFGLEENANLAALRMMP